MNSMIGKPARRITFTLLKDRTYHLLFAVIEELYPDFQDFNDYRDNFVCERINHTDNECRDKIYFSIDFPVITEDLLANPTNDFVFQDSHHTHVICDGIFDRFPVADDCVWVVSHFSSPEILKVLPARNDTRLMKVWISRSFDIPSMVIDSPQLLRQLGELSQLHYGVDLSRYTGVLGKVFLVRYNPYYRSLKVSMSEKPSGIYLEVTGIRRSADRLKIAFVNKNKEGWYEYYTETELDLSRSHHFFTLPDFPDRVEILVKDYEDRLVDAIPPLPFVKAFHVDMNIASSKLALTHTDNSQEQVQKFVSEHFKVAHDSQSSYGKTGSISLSSPQEAYETLESGLEFVFFDGSQDQNEKARNKTKAMEIVKKILSRAKRSCMIADPYFNLNDLTHFIFTMAQSDVTVRVLGSKEYLNASFEAPRTAAAVEQEREAIRKSIGRYVDKYPKFKVQFRLLTGKCPLHDRYIVVDDDVWLVGTSFNEIGGRATTIIKLPRHSGTRVIRELEYWWCNNSKSTPV